MSLSVGIVGLPNVGKSTLFNALTKRQQAAAENYPFCTIEPNSAIVEVSDPRLEKLYVAAVKEGRTVDAAYYRAALKSMYPDWEYKAPPEEAKEEKK